MTIIAAIKQIMRDKGQPMTVDEVFDVIIAKGLYSFPAKNPRSIVYNEIRQHCVGVNPPSYEGKHKHFEKAGKDKHGKDKYFVRDEDAPVDGEIKQLSGEDAAKDETDCIPHDADRRKVVERQIRERRGQQSFRNSLRKRYDDRCVVTGCDILSVLEAAHIKPYRGVDDNDPQNGLLLRADIHTLFDLDLLAIEPQSLQVKLHPDIAKNVEYAALDGESLKCTKNRIPSQTALRIRYEQFKKRRDQSEN
jgi:hypothetical protein